jgi:hypothetical protein
MYLRRLGVAVAALGALLLGLSSPAQAAPATLTISSVAINAAAATPTNAIFNDSVTSVGVGVPPDVSCVRRHFFSNAERRRRSCTARGPRRPGQSRVWT